MHVSLAEGIKRSSQETNKNSNGQLIDMVRLVTGWCNQQNYCGGCYAWLCWLGAGGVRIDVGSASGWCCEVAHTNWSWSHLGRYLMFYLMSCVCVSRYVDTIQEATLNGNKPHIRHGGLSRVFLC